MRKYIVLVLAALFSVAFLLPADAVNWTFTDNVHIQGNLTVDGTSPGGGGSTTSLPWDNITSRPTINSVTVTGTVLDNILNYPAALARLASPTFTGTVTAPKVVIAGTGGGTIDNTVIGGSNARNGTFLALVADNVTTAQGAAGGKLTLKEAAANGTEYRAIKAPDALSDNIVFLLPSADPTDNQVMIWSAPSAGVSTGAWAANGTGSGSGDVVGPASSTDNAVALFSGTTGKLVKNSPGTMAADNVLRGFAGVSTAHVDNTAYIEIMNTGSPGTCNSSRHGWTYFDNTAHSYQVCDTDNTWKAIPTVVAVPSTAGSACVAGVIAFDTSNAYFCVATNTWRRVGISTW